MSFPPPVRKEGASMCHKTIKKKKHLLYGVVIAVSIVLLLSGIFGCIKGENPALHEIVSFDTSYYGTERNPVYAFALRKEDGNWLFSASCPVGDRKNHYTSFGPFPIPAADVEGFLAILRETDEIARLRRYRKPVWTRFIHISDAPARSSGMTFTDGNSIRKETSISDQALDYLYALADKHHQAAENAEMKAVSINRSCMDHSSSYSFTLEKDGNHWFFSFDAAIHRSGAHTEAKGLRIEDDAAEEILRIAKEQQLVNKVKQYEQPPDDGIVLLDETTYQTSFRFMDGSSIYAPIDAGDELAGAFYSLAQANTCPE